ncbi:MAG TPA: Calx-beta domain-containing protein, partial [Chthoniobacteraceae bacterium]|nr:Calx-beta domain-containing protein [Chthoniobacteraceae bacterium]
MRSFIEPLEARIAPATLAISPLIVDEGDESTPDADKVKHITVTLDQAVAQDFTVHYTLVDGSAHLGTQFSPVAGQSADGTLTFAAGATSAQIDVVINGNSTVDHDSNFTIKLDSATGGVNLPAADGLVTIWDDDRTVDFTAASLGQHVNEGGVTTPGQFQYAASLSAAADHPVTVTFQTSNGSGYNDATTLGPAADYTAVTTTFVFQPGQVTTTGATVFIKGDALPGPDEVLTATLGKQSATAPFGAKLGIATTTSTIVNDDDGAGLPALTASLVSDTVSTSEGGVASFGIQLSRLSESPVVITYHTSDGADHTATAGLDYVSATNATKTLDGVSSDAIQVTVNTDTHVENAEKFMLTLDSAKVNDMALDPGAKLSATATIAADPLPKLVFVQLDSTTHLPLPAKNGDVSVIESTPGATGARTADFLVKLAYLDANGNVDNNHVFDLTEADAITVDYATANGTAIGGADATSGDYISKTGTLTFDKTTTNVTDPQTVSVAINPDNVSESSETFTLKLSNVHGSATIGDDTAVGTIADSNITLTVNPISVSEGNQGTSTAVFTIVAAKAIPAGYDLVVDYTTKDGTALSVVGPNQDYQSLVPGQLTFLSGTTFKTLSVPIIGDTVIEGNETFQLQLSNAHLVPAGSAAGTTGTTVGFAGADVDGNIHGTGTILNDDGHAISASITADVATQAEGAAGTKANFTVHLSQAYASPITVNYTVAKTDPVTGIVANTTASFDIPAFTQNAALPIDYVNDDAVGHDQTVTVTLTSLVSTDKTATLVPLVSGKTAKTTVLEDDFYVQILDKSVAEGAAGTNVLLKFPVQLVDVSGNLINHTLDHAVSVSFSTIDGTGATGATSTGSAADFLARTATVTIAAGLKEATADVTIRGDVNVGADETFTVQLGTPTGGKLLTTPIDHSKAVGTIQNDDGATAPTVTLVPLAPGVEAETGVPGSPATFQVLLSAPSEQPVTFQYATNVLTSTNGNEATQEDFTQIPANPAVPATGTIASGQTSATLSVPIVADTHNEGAEFFGFTVSNIAGASNDPASTLTAQGTIAPSNQPTISVANVSVLEGQSGTSTLTFNIQLSSDSDKDVSFMVETLAAGGTATPGVDYVAVDKHLVTIAAHTLSSQQTVTINGDTTTGEGNESFIFRISEPVNAKPAIVDAVGTILNDDATFTIAPTATVHEQDGTATISIIRTGDLTGAAEVAFSTVAGTAVSTGAFPDFVGGPGTVKFADGQASADIKITLIDNNRHEANETFSVQLNSVSNGILGA